MLQKKRKSKCITNIVHSIPIIKSYSNTHNDNNKKSSLRPGISYHCDHSMSSSISLHSIPLLCSMALLGLGIGLISPSINTTYAIGSSAKQKEVTPSISILLDTSNNGLLQKNSSTGVNYLSTTFSVTAQNIDKYQILVRAENDQLSNETGIAIPSIANKTLGKDITGVSWGFALEKGAVEESALPETAFNPIITDLGIPAYSTDADSTLTSVPDYQDFTIAFAANLAGDHITAGHYTNNIILSIAASASAVVNWDTIYYMQDMTSEICANAKEFDTKQLEDKRDNKKYWVAKLRDNNCWMVQNLDFDIPETLDSDSSDVSEDTITNVTKISAIADWKADNLTENSLYKAYYDPGDYIYNGTGDSHAQSDDCTVAGTEVGSLSPFTKCSNFSKSGDSHYHIGNYYSLSAATAGSGDNIKTRGQNIPDSICPANWRLPTSGINSSGALWNTENTKTFANLFSKYGWTWENKTSTSSTNGGTSYNLYNAPFYFVYGGYLTGNGSLTGAGSYGNYSSATSGSQEYLMYSLMFSSWVQPADGSGYRSMGRSVRCVAR